MKEQTVKLLICIASLALLVALVMLPNRQTASAPLLPEETAPPPTIVVDRTGITVGICLPDQTDDWAETAFLLKTALEEKGYAVEFAYGTGTAQGQAEAIDTLIHKGVNCLVVAPIDSAALPMEDPGIPVLSYGSLLMDTEALDGHICYDYFSMGADIAHRIEDALVLPTAADESRSYTVELFMGAARDYNALLLHQGLRSVLDGYLDAGVLECRSGRLEFEDCAIAGWSAGGAAAACATRLEKYYKDEAPNICISASDSIASGVITALDNAGVTQDHWPLVTGNGNTQEGLDNQAAGKQFLTVSTDAADPASACAAMVDLVLFGLQPPFPTEELHNHVRAVPTALCDFELIYG